MSVEKYRQEFDRWLLQARADIKAAQASSDAGSHEWACFQSQQAAEKALKALWFFHNADPWGHSITRLIDSFPDESVRAELTSLSGAARQLDRLYVPTRYPNGLPDMTPSEAFARDDAQQAICMASDILDFVSGRTVEG